MKLKEITSFLEKTAPLCYQESYDNSGLIVGNPADEISGILLTIDTLEVTIDEAIKNKCNLIISHHPIVFSGIKSLTGKNYIERVILKAIKNDIAIYAAHTNFDSINEGVNKKIADKIGVIQTKILAPSKNNLFKLVTFVPEKDTNKIRNAIFDAGAGHIGEYDQCSFNNSGKGSFRASENTNPYKGEKGELHFENEIRIETIFPKHLKGKIITALLSSHPYEEVAYDIYPLENAYNKIGAGMIGVLKKETDEKDFLNHLKNIFDVKTIRHTKLLNKKIRKVAICGGSGSFLLSNAISSKADIFVSADFKYHQFFDAENKIIIADIGHYESEKFTIELFYDLLMKNFSNFAVHLSKIDSNPINYY